MALDTKPPGARPRSVRPTDIPDFSTQSILGQKKSRSEKARAYDEKVQGVLSLAMRMLATNENTVADAAVFIEHGTAFASKMGDLAAHDKRVAHGIDLITTGTENPYAAVVVAALPMIAQIIRNHETETAKPFEIRIPFTKRTFKPKIKIRLNIAFMRALTVHPRQMIHSVFSREDIRAGLISSGVEVALPEYRDVNARH
jgi:hypothetical protein